MINIITYEELLSSIPAEFVLTDTEKNQLREKYDEEVEQLHKWTPKDLPEDSEQLDVRFGKFEEAGTQLIAFGWVIDRRKPWITPAGIGSVRTHRKMFILSGWRLRRRTTTSQGITRRTYGILARYSWSCLALSVLR